VNEKFTKKSRMGFREKFIENWGDDITKMTSSMVNILQFAGLLIKPIDI